MHYGENALVCARNVLFRLAFPVRGLVSVFFLLSTLCALAPTSALAQVRYYYDELGRLIEVVAPDGNSAQYTYDEAGNITSIKKLAATTLSLAEFTPNAGPVGTSVTLNGSGFSTTAVSNTVRFNGTTAVVSAATATSLTVAVPTGATTGTITVTNSNGTATSATAFVVGVTTPVPTITGFAPQIGSAGTVVTVTGTNFQTVVEDNKVLMGNRSAAVIKDAGSPTATQLKVSVPDVGGAGKISVTTPYGKATSAADFYALPAEVNVANVEFKGRLIVDGPALSVSTTVPGKQAVLLFDASVGQRLNLRNASNTYTQILRASVYAPDGKLLQYMIIDNQPIYLPRFSGSASTGTYMIATSPIDKGSIQLSLLADAAGTLAVDGSTAVNLSLGREGRYKFMAEAQKGYGLAAVNFTPAGSSASVTLRKADETSLGACTLSAGSSCDFAPGLFATAGDYWIDLDAGTGSVAFDLLLSKDVGGSVAMDAAVTTATLREAQNARYTLSGTAGQHVSVVLTANTLDDGNAATANYTTVSLFKPSDSIQALGQAYLPPGTTGNTFDVVLPETGIYTVLINPAGLDKGSIGLQAKSYATGLLTVDGGTPINLSAGRNGIYRFAAQPGKGHTLVATGFTSTVAGASVPVTLKKADGTPLVSCAISATSKCRFEPSHFATAATYYVEFNPQDLAAVSFSAVLSKDVEASATIDAPSPTTVSLPLPGQRGKVTFNATAGGAANLVITGNTLDDGDASTPANQTQLSFAAPNGALGPYLTVPAGGTGQSVNVPFSQTGQYTAWIVTGGLDKGTLAFTLTNANQTGTLPVDGAAVPVSLAAGVTGKYTFTAEAGKGYTIALRNFTSAMYINLRSPANVVLANQYVSVSDRSTYFQPSHFATPGTYTLEFLTPSSSAVAFDAVLSKDVVGTLALDTSTPVSLSINREAQVGRYSFTGTAGQSISVVTTSNTLDDGNAATNRTTTLSVAAPSNPMSSIASAYLPTGVQNNVLDVTLTETGTHYLVVSPEDLDKGVLGVQVKTALAGTLTVDASTAISLSAGRNARYTFTGEAGKGYGLAMSGLTFTPAGGTISVKLRRADGMVLSTCDFTASGSCNFAPDLFVAAGTYQMEFNPAGFNGASFDAVLSKDASGTLAIDAASPTTVAIARAGQNARYTFSGTAGQSLSVTLIDSTADAVTPGSPNITSAFLYKPSDPVNAAAGVALWAVAPGGDAMDLQLPETGTYTLYLDPAGIDKGNISAHVRMDQAGALVVDGTTAISIAAGRKARHTFTAEAGKGYGLALTGLAFTPATSSSMSVRLLKSDGSVLQNDGCGYQLKCNFAPDKFPTAGTYSIEFNPPELSAANFSAVLNKDLTGTFTVDAATPTTLAFARAGQNARYTFTGTAGQSISLLFSGNTLDDGNATTNPYTEIYWYQPSNAAYPFASTGIRSASATPSSLDAVLPETGTYTVWVRPGGLDKGSIGLRVKKN